MRELSDIIEFENENTSLDFKSIQYKKEQFENFLKDVISLANGISREEKYIIIGVKFKPNGDREILGIQDEFIDEATYQQIVNNNIEPEIIFQYFSFEFENKILGIFHLKDISNPPYMMKKDFGKLKQGDSFIRKGSHQTKLTRSDLDKITFNKINLNSFEGKVRFSFDEFEMLTEKNIDQAEIILPSTKAEKRIKRIIELKEYEELNKPSSSTYRFPRITSFGSLSYEERDLATLRQNLENIKETYKNDDLYYYFEENAHKINFYIWNNNNEYIEDASIEITLKTDNILVSQTIYPKPPKHDIIPIISLNDGPSWEKINYPEITKTADVIKIFQSIGNIKHQIPQSSLKVPFRLVLSKPCKGNMIALNIKLYGKNLPQPITETLILKIQ